MRTRRNNFSKKPKQRRSPGHVLWKLTKILSLLIAMGVIFTGATATGYVASLVKDDPVRSFDELNARIFTKHLTGFAYYRDKEAIGQLRTEQDRRLIKKEDVSIHLINAIIATEDRHFYEHRGVDLSGTARATLQSALSSATQTGGSTLTQQLVKQTVLSPKVSHERKAKEILLSMRVERMFSKDQILEAYMNEMYFGRSANHTNIYGVQAAAKGIFGVEAKQLNIPQAAYIAGMLQAPSRYIPFDEKGLEAGLKRQKLVLNRMRENGYITEKEKREALAFDLQSSLAKSSPQPYKESPFLMMEIEERAARVLVDQHIEQNPHIKSEELSRQAYRQLVNEKRKEILRGGYHIYTTIDREIYEMMNKIAKNPANFGPNRNYTVNLGTETKEITNALEEVGATLIDNKTGAILGFIGGRDFNAQQVNHAKRPRQPGSAMKPIAAYAPALELGLLQPGSAIDDAPLALENGAGNPPHYPANWNNKFQGLITVREAIKWSYNIPAVKAFLAVGIPEALGYVERMGVTTIVTPEDNPKTNDFQAKTGVLGGLTQGLTVEEITNAYSVFPNEGAFIDAYLISKIENADGETVYRHRIKPQKIFSQQTAYLMTDMLRNVVQEGTGAATRRLLKTNRDIAGKTGTTNDDHDSWFVGYTPELTLGVWIGYDIPYRLPKASLPRSTQIWSQIMNGLADLYPERYPKDSTFKQPAGIVRRSVCAASGKLPSPLCEEAGKVITEIFNEKYVPNEIDDSYEKARIVTFKGKKYLARDKTPEDMTQTRIGVRSPEPVQFPKDPKAYKMSFEPLDWKERLPEELDPRIDDGRAPSEPRNVRVIEPLKIVWEANAESDVVGYRVYHSKSGDSFLKTAVIPQVGLTQYEAKKEGVYYVTAVDVSGNESGASNTIDVKSKKRGNEAQPERKKGKKKKQAPFQQDDESSDDSLSRSLLPSVEP